MGNLSFFLAQNVPGVENVKYVASKRIVDGDKKPIEWEIRCATSDEDAALKKQCTKRRPIVGKKGAYMPETDFPAYVGLLAVGCTVYPDLNNAQLQDSYHVMGADALLKRMLTPGEYQEYLNKVQEVNGFDIAFEDLVDESKN